MRFFKCLDHDQMIGSRIYMSKVINLSKILFPVVQFAPIDEQKVFKTLIFFIFSYFKQYRSSSMELILYLNVMGLSLSGKDAGSNPSACTQVCIYIIYMGSVILHCSGKFSVEFFMHQIVEIDE